MHFIYVMSKKDRDKMLALGYAMLKEDKRNKVFVFKCKDEKISCEDEIVNAGIKHIMSNILTF